MKLFICSSLSVHLYLFIFICSSLSARLYLFVQQGERLFQKSLVAGIRSGLDLL